MPFLFGRLGRNVVTFSPKRRTSTRNSTGMCFGIWLCSGMHRARTRLRCPLSILGPRTREAKIMAADWTIASVPGQGLKKKQFDKTFKHLPGTLPSGKRLHDFLVFFATLWHFCEGNPSLTFMDSTGFPVLRQPPKISGKLVRSRIVLQKLTAKPFGMAGNGCSVARKTPGCFHWPKLAYWISIQKHVSKWPVDPVCYLLYKGGLYSSAFVGNPTSHYKDSYEPTRISWNTTRVLLHLASFDFTSCFFEFFGSKMRPRNMCLWSLSRLFQTGKRTGETGILSGHTCSTFAKIMLLLDQLTFSFKEHFFQEPWHTHMGKKVEFPDPSERSPFKNRLIYVKIIYLRVYQRKINNSST